MQATSRLNFNPEVERDLYMQICVSRANTGTSANEEIQEGNINQQTVSMYITRNKNVHGRKIEKEKQLTDMEKGKKAKADIEKLMILSIMKEPMNNLRQLSMYFHFPDVEVMRDASGDTRKKQTNPKLPLCLVSPRFHLQQIKKKRNPACLELQYFSAARF